MTQAQDMQVTSTQTQEPRSGSQKRDSTTLLKLTSELTCFLQKAGTSSSCTRLPNAKVCAKSLLEVLVLFFPSPGLLVPSLRVVGECLA